MIRGANNEALRLFNKAIELDPSFALASFAFCRAAAGQDNLVNKVGLLQRCPVPRNRQAEQIDVLEAQRRRRADKFLIWRQARPGFLLCACAFPQP
jgi:hypothetical protein